MCVLKHLPYLQNRPAALQERVFQKLFDAAEMARFAPEERVKYGERLKYYRDLKNVVDPSFEESRAAEKIKSHEAGIDMGVISPITGKSVEEMQKIIKEAGR